MNKLKPVEKASINDVPEMHKLINSFADRGEMLARSLSEIYENVRDYFIVRDGERVIACRVQDNLGAEAIGTLKEKGYLVEDTPDGRRIKRI